MRPKPGHGRRRPPPFARRARVTDTGLEIDLDDGTTVECSLDAYPGILLAPEHARNNVRVVPPGLELRWPDLGYELCIEGLLRESVVKPPTPARGARARRAASRRK